MEKKGKRKIFIAPDFVERSDQRRFYAFVNSESAPGAA